MSGKETRELYEMEKTNLTSDLNALVERLIPDDELTPEFMRSVPELPAFAGKMRAFESYFEKPFGELDIEIQQALVLRRLQQMVYTLRLNPAWRERIGTAGLNGVPRDFEEWQQLPVADKETMQELYMGSRPGLVVPLSYGGFEVLGSGGTTGGRPIETVYSLRELHDTYRIAGDFMERYMLAGPLKGDEPKWVLTTLADYQMWSSGTMVGGVLQEIPGVNYVAAGQMSKSVFHHFLSYPGPKAVMATSQGIGLLSDLSVGLDDAARHGLRAALYGSGLLPRRKQIELKKHFPKVEILSYFAATQAETIGLQLSPDSYLAAVPGLHLIEIVDERGRWVDEGEEGELVVTRLHAHEAPLPRLKLGDRMVRRAPLRGPNLQTEQFEFASRSGDIIHLYETHYAAPNVYNSLCGELRKAGIDLDGIAHEVQFRNARKMETLSLVAAVDDVGETSRLMAQCLGEAGVRRVFIESLSRARSIFNQADDHLIYSIWDIKYQFEIKLVEQGSSEIYRTKLGKVPLIRDLA